MDYFLFGSLFYLLGGIIPLFFKDKDKSKVFVIFASIALLFLFPFSLNILLGGDKIESLFLFNLPIGTVPVRIDPLSAFFILIISLGGFFSAIYSSGYMKIYLEEYSLSSFYFFLGLLIFSMLMVVTVQNAIMFLIIWEIMSLSSYFLVLFENKKEDIRKNSNYYLIAMQIGAAFLIAAFSLISVKSNSVDFLDFKSLLNNQNKYSFLLFILFFIGFGTKAGFAPFHTWLPKAHPSAPTGISAIMSGVMTKTGIYGILRIISLMDVIDPFIAYMIFYIGLITGIIGIINAISQDDIKRFLAYSSIENVGIIGTALGLGLIGIVYEIKFVALMGLIGAILHIINHFTFKSVLFFGSGIIYSQTHTRSLNKLGGLIKFLPITSVMFLISSLAISGLPLFNGFISEFAIYLGFVKAFSFSNVFVNVGAILGLSGLAFIGSVALLGFTKLYGICFLGIQRNEFHIQPNEKNRLLLTPMLILTGMIIISGIFPYVMLILIKNILYQFLHYDFEKDFKFISDIYGSISIVLLVFLALALFIYFIRYLLLKNRKIEEFKTWDCGYQITSSRLQYTGGSFVQPFLHLVKEMVPQKIEVKKEQILFPEKASLVSYTHDFLEKFLIQPVVKFLKLSMELFAWIQSGKMQQYIIYGLIFLLFILIWIFGVS
ncbi:proton-conducting transporter transmembrane domain-containing protein [Rosettibacter firmus]|uniref:proton-conducting transporter transmembrane domain-containing protein n=1 Tax=Rosettibacter firmus TaxID=3111522 RepID=UPI00336C129D